MSDDRKEKIGLLKVLYETLGRKTYSVESVKHIVEAFEEVTVEEMRHAVPVILREFSDLPALSDLIDFIKSGHVRRIRTVEVCGRWEAALEQLDRDEEGIFE